MAQIIVPTPEVSTVVLSLQDVTAVGPPGPQGIQGVQGIQGPVGPLGPPLTMKGTVASHTNLPASGNTANDTWMTLDTGHAWAWSGTAWIDLGPFTGPQGAQGVQGVQGIPGVAATIVAGTTTTAAAGTPANVVNTGSATAAIFQFTIPQGIQGVQGVQGNQGIQGVQGQQGVQGVQGPPGPPLNMKGTVASASALPPTGNVTGDMYMVLDTGHAWVWGGSAWIDAGPFQGPQGIQGVGCVMKTTAAFIVPAIGSSVSVNVDDSTYPVVGEMVYVAGAGGTGVAGALQVTAKVPGQVTLTTPVAAQPVVPIADNTQAGLANILSGRATDFIGGDNACHPAVSAFPAGSVIDFAGSTAPAGFLLCDGASYATATYPNLFAAIGYTFGGSGANFLVPDARGRVVVGAGQGTALTNRALGAIGGAETHTLSVAEIAAHAHSISISDPQHAHVVPAHGHGFNDPSHAHTAGNHQHLVMNHTHGVSDPSHTHAYGTYDGFTPGANGFWRGTGAGLATSASGTGVTTQGNGNAWTDADTGGRGGIGTYAAGTGCSVANAGAFWDNNNATGISAGCANAGSGSAHNNLQPFINLNRIIKT